MCLPDKWKLLILSVTFCLLIIPLGLAIDRLVIRREQWLYSAKCLNVGYELKCIPHDNCDLWSYAQIADSECQTPVRLREPEHFEGKYAGHRVDFIHRLDWDLQMSKPCWYLNNCEYFVLNEPLVEYENKMKHWSGLIMVGLIVMFMIYTLCPMTAIIYRMYKAKKRAKENKEYEMAQRRRVAIGRSTRSHHYPPRSRDPQEISKPEIPKPEMSSSPPPLPTYGTVSALYGVSKPSTLEEFDMDLEQQTYADGIYNPY